METDWALIDELEDDAPISEQAARNLRRGASAGCLICALDDWDGE